MYCSKCSYTSFDHLSNCPKCGLDWTEEKKKLNLDWLQSGDQPWLVNGPHNSGQKDVHHGSADEDYFNPEISSEDSELVKEEEETGESIKKVHSPDDAPSFSLDLGGELEPDKEYAVKESSPRIQEEIEFPDLDLSEPKDNGK